MHTSCSSPTVLGGRVSSVLLQEEGKEETPPKVAKVKYAKQKDDSRGGGRELVCFSISFSTGLMHHKAVPREEQEQDKNYSLCKIGEQNTGRKQRTTSQPELCREFKNQPQFPYTTGAPLCFLPPPAQPPLDTNTTCSKTSLLE